MKSESKTSSKKTKSRLVDLDSALLSLKHSRLSQIASGVRDLPKNMSSSGTTDFLTKIGMNVLERAQSVRDSLMNTVKARTASPAAATNSKAAPRMKKAVTAKAVVQTKAKSPAKAKKAAVKSKATKSPAKKAKKK